MSAMAADEPEVASERSTHAGAARMKDGGLKRRLRRTEGVVGCAASRPATLAVADVARGPWASPELAGVRQGGAAATMSQAIACDQAPTPGSPTSRRLVIVACLTEWR